MTDNTKMTEIELDTNTAEIANGIAKLAQTTIDKVVSVVLASAMYDEDEDTRKKYGLDKRAAVAKITHNTEDFIDKVDQARDKYLAEKLRNEESKKV